MKSKTKVIKPAKKATKELEKLAKSLVGPDLVKVGLPKGSNDYPDGTSVIMVGAVHEFGSPARNIPQRSFLRATVESGRRKYRQLFKRLSKKIVDGEISKKEALGIIGLQVQSDVQGRITDGIAPDLKSREGTPLIDTGHLRQSIIFEVED
jgi:phage gpG-like protein